MCAPDVRGVGDLLPEFGRGSPRYTRSHQAEEDYAWSALMLGKPLAGQRTTDLLAVSAALRAHAPLAGKPLKLAATGHLTVPALFAAALDPGISALYLCRDMESFRAIVDSEDYGVPFANFVPRILLHTDLPEITASIAPRKVTTGTAWDVESLYALCSQPS